MLKLVIIIANYISVYFDYGTDDLVIQDYLLR